MMLGVAGNFLPAWHPEDMLNTGINSLKTE
jgi:hypothetical protein